MTTTLLKRTPWGMPQDIEEIGNDIRFYSTASHGGYKVPSKLNKEIPEAFRAKDGWYEEDCAWAIVWVFLSCYFTEFKPETFIQADTTLKRWYAHEWQDYHGLTRQYSPNCVDCNHESKRYCHDKG